ncbi:MAG TPA: acryloyl-CoA reductase [Acidimicrobiales bacterium]|nr:acryloyl-CoA reductase [Acidimicrobiales bacterium]
MRALVITESDTAVTLSVEDIGPHDVDPSDAHVVVDYSGVNYKDAMVAAARSRVRKVARVVGGVDAAGTLTEPLGALSAGTAVAVHGGGLGVERDGGFATEVWAPARWISPLPEGLNPRAAMIVGTAGWTAMASVLALEHHGLAPGAEVLVTGATGGVGSQAVFYLARRGYRPVASTGSPDATAWLQGLGATEVIGREDVADRPDRVLGSERWDGAIDCVGGPTLAQILRALRHGAAVAASGLVASADLATTVYPFITRAVSLIGVDAVEAPSTQRARVWSEIARTARAQDLEVFVDREVGLGELAAALLDVREGRTRGRILVDPRR